VNPKEVEVLSDYVAWQPAITGEVVDSRAYFARCENCDRPGCRGCIGCSACSTGGGGDEGGGDD